MENQKNELLARYKCRQMILTLLPLAALIVLFAVLCITVQSKGYRLDMYLKIIFNESVVLAVVATGATFIYTLGSFDISLGASTLFSAACGVMAYNATGSMAVMLLVLFAVAVGCSLASSVLASVFGVPVFVTTVAMMSVLSAVSAQIITTNGGALGGISIPSEVVKPFDVIWFKVLVLAVFVAVCIFLFDFTRVGRRQKFLGGNPVCAKLTGINLNKYAIIAFVMAGIGVGIGAFLTLVYTPSVTTGTASSIGMNIIVAIVFGGMPISGGPRSRIYAALVGGFSYIMLNNILKILIDTNAGYGISQVVSAVFFLAVVYLTGLNYRSQLLPR
ncbi:MAG: inner-membrane translocator [Subdoligranulum sp.]|nr:inner-membrane translocator [Subdoligranulum sp.]